MHLLRRVGPRLDSLGRRWLAWTRRGIGGRCSRFTGLDVWQRVR